MVAHDLLNETLDFETLKGPNGVFEIGEEVRFYAPKISRRGRWRYGKVDKILNPFSCLVCDTKTGQDWYLEVEDLWKI